ncbi:hypothetical protein [Streptomyces sp. 6-11-2]|uniref:hypothetical protein n=1 Tax=Streptomyces sp. 6-11-2 TaxID=2585753 RepID=UPI001169D5DF|nr:hypothetical protein [Streptomyces sp. 6-11-2]GED89873.1 hypothetical protein TNCT6_69580 [Streptomyces sp. 6-11-2]
MTSENVAEHEAVEAAAAVSAKAVDDQLIDELVTRAQAEGLQLYAQQCSELYTAGGFAAVRRTAQAGLDQVGPTAVLYRWLGLAHAAEDEDDHDAAAERAYQQGLASAPDDLGLLVCYLELCLRADAFDYPARAGRVATLRARIDELAPARSPEREHVDDALSWAGRGYWDDLVAAAGRGELRQAESAELSDRVASALRTGSTGTDSSTAAGEDRSRQQVGRRGRNLTKHMPTWGGA